MNKDGNEMKNYMMINGKRIELTDDQVKLILADETKKSPFDRVDIGEIYYHIGTGFVANTCVENNDYIDDALYDAANYCTDENIMKQHALHMMLNNLMWRYSMTHGGDKMSFERSTEEKYCIYYDNDTKDFYIYNSVYIKFLGNVYFFDDKTAKAAIEEIVKPFIEAHPEFDVTKM